MIMLQALKDWWFDLKCDFDDWWYKNTPEYREFVHQRVKAHKLAIKEGRNSPYTHPQEYNF